MSAKKMSGAITRRDVSPIMQYIRGKLLKIRRAGYPDEEAKLHYPTRWSNEQAARTQPDPNITPGVHHKLAENYYLSRDGRRTVDPPAALYNYKGEEEVIAEALANPLPQPEAIVKGPDVNFGLKAPTPGFGIEMERNPATEEVHCQLNKQFKFLERYDRYHSSQ